MYKLYARDPMTNEEKKLLDANRKLVKKNIELETDIRVLISYLKGRKHLKEDVKDIIKYYSQKKKETDE
jgi:hypothetical protein